MQKIGHTVGVLMVHSKLKHQQQHIQHLPRVVPLGVSISRDKARRQVRQHTLSQITKALCRCKLRELFVGINLPAKLDEY